ncbi:MAG: hypothetical protein PUB20_08055 [Clostridia bacterium]|nr:hypothetical protein [Clostridia bacterium]
MEKAEKTTKKEKTIRKTSKYIWLGISVVVALVAAILRNATESLPSAVKVLLSAVILFTIIIAAQKASIERFSYAGDNPDKKKYALLTVLYYALILLAVFDIFFCLWVSKILFI